MTDIQNESMEWNDLPFLRILKCHKCKKVWIYTGGAKSYCICSRCRTSVYLANRTVPIMWDKSPEFMEGVALTLRNKGDDIQYDLAKKYGGKATVFVDLYDREIKVGVDVFSEDMMNFHTVYLDDAIDLSILDIGEPDLLESVWNPSQNLKKSGRYSLSPRLKEHLKSIFVE